MRPFSYYGPLTVEVALLLLLLLLLSIIIIIIIVIIIIIIIVIKGEYVDEDSGLDKTASID